MKVVLDENIPRRTRVWLATGGHVVIDATQPPLRGADDDALWNTAQQEQALLVTTDRGFAAKWAEAHFGILIVRLRQPDREKIHDRIVRAMLRHSESDWPGLLCVMRDQVMSTRRAPRRGDDTDPKS